jgi:hypothetical protein
MIKLGEGETDRDERPLYPHKILKTKVTICVIDGYMINDITSA